MAQDVEIRGQDSLPRNQAVPVAIIHVRKQAELELGIQQTQSS
jgi:hypothetical protein